MKKKTDDESLFWAVVFILSLAVAILLIIKEARGQEPTIIPVGRTAFTIDPYFELEPIVEPMIVKPKEEDYCPLREGDYQCPMEVQETERESNLWANRGNKK